MKFLLKDLLSEWILSEDNKLSRSSMHDCKSAMHRCRCFVCRKGSISFYDFLRGYTLTMLSMLEADGLTFVRKKLWYSTIFLWTVLSLGVNSLVGILSPYNLGTEKRKENFLCTFSYSISYISILFLLLSLLYCTRSYFVFYDVVFSLKFLCLRGTFFWREKLCNICNPNRSEDFRKFLFFFHQTVLNEKIWGTKKSSMWSF